MKLAVFMDPLEQLKPYKDTTVAMIQRAQQQGWSCAFFTTSDLFCSDGTAYARMREITITDIHQEAFALTKDLGDQALSNFDIILMRKEPPFDLEFIYATYSVELAEKEGVLVANKPQSLRDANEKCFALHFPQCMPKTLVSRDIKRLKEFWSAHKNVVFKPLDSMGGNSIFHVDERGQNISVILEVLTHNQTVTIMAQHYIPEISELGDKRIILINGIPVPFALARIPQKGELRGNLAAGAQGKVVELTQRDRWICDQIAPVLQKKGLYFVGIDVIGSYLTEINVTCPTCAREIMAETSLDITGDYLQFLSNSVKFELL